MKRIVSILAVAILLTACQKEDKNGDLGGFWKLLQIEETATEKVINKRNEDCFWSIQLKLIEINEKLGRFQHTGDSLFVQMIETTGNMSDYGIYNQKNERFRVNHLDRNGMILESKHAVLTFRKF